MSTLRILSMQFCFYVTTRSSDKCWMWMRLCLVAKSARLHLSKLLIETNDYIHSKKALHFAEGFKGSESINWIVFLLFWGRNGIIITIYAHTDIILTHKNWQQSNVSTCIDTYIIQINVGLLTKILWQRAEMQTVR